jgi:hypothetical protein
VDDTPEVHREKLLPVFYLIQTRTTGRNTRIVHQYIRSAEMVAHLALEMLDRFQLTDIRFDCHHLGSAARGFLDLLDGSVKTALRRCVPRSAIQTLSPKEAKRLAAASPMPEAPPVITATEPADNLFSVLNEAPFMRSCV